MTIASLSSRRVWLPAAVLAAGAVVGVMAWRTLSPREATDDAQVSGHVSPVAARVSGTVLRVPVTDNQSVAAGDVLVELDPRDYQLAVARAEADLAAAEAAFRAAHHNVPITSTTATADVQVADAAADNAGAGLVAADREVDAARARLATAAARATEARAHATRARQDLARLAPLAAKDEIPRRQLDAATADHEAADAAVNAADAAVTEAQANLDAARARRTQAAGEVAQARSQAHAAATAPEQVALIKARASAADAEVALARTTLEQARLMLERATVRAPVAGVVSRRSVEVGQVVQPGQSLMLVTALDTVWVTANFKETQVESIAAGQPAEITVDAYGGARFRGHVDSIAAATGAMFSLLPPDNATGNFVKVVQRIPVKIVLDPADRGDSVLRPGMSVNATVYLR